MKGSVQNYRMKHYWVVIPDSRENIYIYIVHRILQCNSAPWISMFSAYFCFYSVCLIESVSYEPSIWWLIRMAQRLIAV
jgi:hypothetical protein